MHGKALFLGLWSSVSNIEAVDNCSFIVITIMKKRVLNYTIDSIFYPEIRRVHGVLRWAAKEADVHECTVRASPLVRVARREFRQAGVALTFSRLKIIHKRQFCISMHHENNLLTTQFTFLDYENTGE